MTDFKKKVNQILGDFAEIQKLRNMKRRFKVTWVENHEVTVSAHTLGEAENEALEIAEGGIKKLDTFINRNMVKVEELDKFCPKCETKNWYFLSNCHECGGKLPEWGE